MKTLPPLIATLCLLCIAGTHAFGFGKICKTCGKKTCYVEEEKKKVKKSYYVVECVDVCIPGIRFPWQKCKKPCGRVRKVARLVKKSYEVEECACKWTVVDKCESCQECADGRCGEVIHQGPVITQGATIAHPHETLPVAPAPVEKLPVSPKPAK